MSRVTPYRPAAWQSTKPLKHQLVALVMLISVVGTIASSVIIYAIMRQLLFERVDDQLEDGINTWAQQHNPAWQFSFWSLPSDFTQSTLYPGQAEPMLRRGTDSPPDYSQLTRLDKPKTVSSAPGSATERKWRAIAHQETDGTVQYVAKSLDSERRMLATLAWVEASVGILVLAGIGWASNRYVGKALAPLKEVENTALAIAEGDMDRRVPTWSKNTEVGKLSSAVNTMVGQLQESLENAQAQEEQMRRFVGDASHELRTPLTSVRGYAELYRMGGAPADMVLGKIDEESARMQLLVEDLLALTRAEGSRLEHKPVDALELVLSVKDSARAAFPNRVMEVVNDTTKPPVVDGDSARLHQVLLNLVTNAFKHAGEDAEVTVYVRENLDRVVIDVVDNGCGMEPKDAEHIFERFYRADTSRTRASGGGSGLGLAITKSLVEAHGGTIRVTTKRGEGSTFTLSLPAA